MSVPGPARVGRPRVAGGSGSGAATPREEILEAAAALFTERGYAATSTRAIAERVGIRQASLYHHFAGKDELLLELLETSVRPSLDYLDAVEAAISAGTDPAAALYALAAIDVGTLLAVPHNIGALYLTPEVQDPRFASFRAERDQLRSAYQRLAARIDTGTDDTNADPDFVGTSCMHLVELVISLRRDGEPGPRTAESIAAACLRVAGREDAVAAGQALLQRVLAG